MTRFLVTGGGGFVGQWLTKQLLQRGDDVTLAGVGSLDAGPRILSDEERRAVQWATVDVRSIDELAAAVDATSPDVIAHLAGIAFPPAGDRDPTMMYDVNVLGAVHLLALVGERRRAGTLDPVLLIVGSAVQYGRHDAHEMPLDETAEQRPITVYGASKAAQEIAALQAARANGVRVVCTRSFNHSGVGHGAEYLLPSLVRRVRTLAREGGHVLALGNDVVRDYLHVEDVARAYLALAARGHAGEVYNVASGMGISVRQLAADVLHHAGVPADITTDPSLVRPTDIPVLVGSPAKLIRDTGWAPVKTHADIIEDLLHAATD